MKIYTHDCLNKDIQDKLTTKEYGSISKFLQGVYRNVCEFGHKYKYTNYNRPVYLGVHPRSIKKDQYEIGDIGQWSTFVNSTVNESIAAFKSYDNQKSKDELEGEIV